MSVRRHFTADQNIVQIGIGPQVIDRWQYICKFHARMPGNSAGRKNVALDTHAGVQSWLQTCYPEQVPVAEHLCSRCSGSKAHRDDAPLTAFIDTSELGYAVVGLR